MSSKMVANSIIRNIVFRARLATNAEDLTVEQRQQIIRLVVREVRGATRIEVVSRA